jgi:2-polyprenyl-3-methyl-5-hydroxy-6-metoxy-1,4-benzoquinol methylase
MSAQNQPAKGTIRTAPIGKCHLCGSEGSPLYSGLSDPYFGATGLWSHKKCPNPKCGLIWLDPAPITEDLYLAYQSYFTHGTQDGVPSLGSRIRGLCYSAYQSLHKIPATVFGLGTAKAEITSMFLGDMKPGKLLDVGCGDGKYLNRMRPLGWSVEGVDFDSKAVANAKVQYGLDLHCGNLQDANFSSEMFDAVTMSHVIEHLPEPLVLLKEIQRILKPGGRLVVTTPNSDSLGHQKFGSYWFGIDPPRHLKIYSPRTLRICAEKLGFKSIRTLTSAANADIFLGGSFSIRDSADHRTSAQPAPNPLRIAKTILLQYREHSKLSSNPDLGEEVALICCK